MPAEPEVLSLEQVVDRAADVADPYGEHDGVGELRLRFEDRDEPVTAILSVNTEVTEAQQALDPEDDDAQLVMMRAVAIYLAHRRTLVDNDREDLLRQAALNEFDGKPPEHVTDWLVQQGVTL